MIESVLNPWGLLLTLRREFYGTICHTVRFLQVNFTWSSQCDHADPMTEKRKSVSSFETIGYFRHKLHKRRNANSSHCEEVDGWHDTFSARCLAPRIRRKKKKKKKKKSAALSRHHIHPTQHTPQQNPVILFQDSDDGDPHSSNRYERRGVFLR